MMSVIASTLFSVLLAQQEAAEPPVAEQDAKAVAPDAIERLKSAFEVLRSATGYRFEVRTESITNGGFGGFGGGRGGRGGFGGDDRSPIVVEYQAGVPMHVKRGDLEAFVAGDTLVSKNEEGEWQLFDREAMRGAFGRGGRGGRGGDRGARSGGDEGDTQGGAEGDTQGGAEGDTQGGSQGKTQGGTEGGTGGTEGDTQGGTEGGREGRAGGDSQGDAGRGPEGRRGERSGRGGRRGAMAIFQLQRVRPPHELLAGASDQISDVVAEVLEDGRTVFRGKLGEQAVLALSQSGFGRGGRGGFGGGRGGFGGEEGEGPEREISGSFEVTLDAQGVISSIVVDTHMSIEFGDRSFERDRKVTYSISGVNATDVEIPEEALVHFEF